MRVSNHAIKRCKERGFDSDRLEDDIIKYWSTVRYNIRTGAFYVKAKKLLIVIKNKTILTVYSRAKYEAKRRVGTNYDSIPVPKNLIEMLLCYQVFENELTLSDFRDFKKYHINFQ